MLDRFSDKEMMQEVLREAQTGLWVIEMDEGREPRMYGDAAMQELLGQEGELTPEEFYHLWYDRIHEQDYPVVQDAVGKLVSDVRAEVQYRWHHPAWGQIYVRCGGVRDFNYTQGICLRGYHQNITDTITLKREYDAVIKTLSESYSGIFLWNLRDGTFKVIKMPELLQDGVAKQVDFVRFLQWYIDTEIAADFQQAVREAVDIKAVRKRIDAGERQIECLYRNQQGGWRRVRLVRSEQYSEEYPWVIAAFDEQDSEVEKKLDDASSQIAVSQIYRLVVSTDLERRDYNCIHYSGNQLKLSRHGSFADYYSQLISWMPSEDRDIFERIYDLDNYDRVGYLDGILRLWDGDGVLHYYNYYAARVSTDMGQRILLTVRNIDNKQQQQQREQVLSNLCQCYYSIYLFDLEHNIEEAIWQEDYIYRAHEFPKGELNRYYHKFVENYVYEEDQEKMERAGNPEFLQRTLSADQPVYEVDFRRRYPEGLQWVRSRFSIADMRDGVVTKVIFANMNIHEQKQEELKEEEQNRAALVTAYEAAKEASEIKSNFLAQMSHDIRTPMNAIVGMSSIAAAHADNPEKVRDCLDKIHSSSHHLLSLINAILDMSKIEKGKLELLDEPFHLGEMLEQISSMMRVTAEEKKLDLEFRTKGVIHDALQGDANRIRQVLVNLIGNAVKYTPEGGYVIVTTQEVSERSKGTGCFVFTVEDNGIGMTEAFTKCIFAPFTRAEDVSHIQGTGLGMSIAYGIVEAMKGDIRVESEKGKGSRFTVTLYLKIAEENADAEAGVRIVADSSLAKEGQGQSWNGVHILLAEDNQLNMEIAKTILEEAGLSVDGVNDGKKALEAFSSSAPGTYQGIFMDIQMPVMDGYEATRQIRNCGHPQAADIPIIALTANAFAEDIAKALTAGMNDHVPKPVDYDRLLGVLGKNLA